MDDKLKAFEGKLADTQLSCQAHAREMIHFQQQLDDLRNRVQALEAAAKLQPADDKQPLKQVKIADEEYWEDASGNRWNCSRYDLKAALEAWSTMYNCRNCTNCFSCTNCSDCNSCSYCETCKSCVNCTYCNACRGCDECIHCSWCTDCKVCVHCVDVKNRQNY